MYTSGLVMYTRTIMSRPPLGLSKSRCKDDFWSVIKVVFYKREHGCRIRKKKYIDHTIDDTEKFQEKIRRNNPEIALDNIYYIKCQPLDELLYLSEILIVEIHLSLLFISFAIK